MLVLVLVTDSLRRIGVIAESESPSAEEGQDATTRLNDLMFQLAEQGIDLGWNRKATTADTLVLPDGLLNGIKSMLCELLAIEYGVELAPLILKEAEDARNRLLRLSLQRQFGQPTLGLPIGESNNGIFNISTGAFL